MLAKWKLVHGKMSFSMHTNHLLETEGRGVQLSNVTFTPDGCCVGATLIKASGHWPLSHGLRPTAYGP